MNDLRFLIVLEQLVPSGKLTTFCVDLCKERDVNIMNQYGFTKVDILHIQSFGSGNKNTTNEIGQKVFVTLIKDNVREAIRMSRIEQLEAETDQEGYGNV